MAEPCLSGLSILNSRQSLEEVAGVEAVAKAVASLSDADREIYEAALPESWVPVRIADEVQRAVAAESGVPPGEFADFVRRFCHRTTERMVSTIWRILLRFTSDKALVERTPEFHSRTYNVGRLEARVEQPGVGVVELVEWPDVSEEQMLGIAGGIEAVLQVAGRREVRVRWTRTSGGIRYHVTWKG